MTLSSMVVSRDWQEVSVLECILGGLHMDVAVEQEPQRAMSPPHPFQSRRSDCRLRSQRQRPVSPRIAAARAAAEHRAARHYGNPASSPNRGIDGSVVRIQETDFGGASCPHSFRGAQYDSRRPPALSPRRFGSAGIAQLQRRKSPIEAHLINVAKGACRFDSRLPGGNEEAFQVSFELPGAKNAMKAHAEVAWQDARGNVGIRFVKVTPRQQRTLQLWLAQQYFQNLERSTNPVLLQAFLPLWANRFTAFSRPL